MTVAVTAQLTAALGDRAGWLLPALVGLPLLAALALLALRRVADTPATVAAAAVAALTLALAVLVVTAGPRTTAPPGAWTPTPTGSPRWGCVPIWPSTASRRRSCS